jgi:hypothetical protein
LLTIQKEQAKYFEFRREKALVESGLNLLGRHYSGKNMRGCRHRQKHQRSEPSIHFLIYVLAFVDPVMHCALVIVISQYVHFEEWRNIIINIINVADNSSYHFTNNAHDEKYICTEDITTLQLHCLVLCNIKFLCSWKQNISSMF